MNASKQNDCLAIQPDQVHDSSVIHSTAPELCRIFTIHCSANEPQTIKLNKTSTAKLIDLPIYIRELVQPLSTKGTVRLFVRSGRYVISLVNILKDFETQGSPMAVVHELTSRFGAGKHFGKPKLTLIGSSTYCCYPSCKVFEPFFGSFFFRFTFTTLMIPRMLLIKLITCI